MIEQNQQSESLQELKDIKRMMERSSRFISLSGLSGIAAGVCALAGAWRAKEYLDNYYGSYNSSGFFSGDDFSKLKLNLLILAVIVFAAAFLSSFFFTWQKAKKQNLPLWNMTSRKLFWSMSIPLATGTCFIIAMLRYDDWAYIAPSCLIFYGLALVNASKYTFTDVQFLGYGQIILGLLNMLYIGKGIYFWAAGFGILHIIYGVIMWWKYEREAWPPSPKGEKE
jgi:heme/copper-type cytochrome/quinol oxidase subunit 3